MWVYFGRCPDGGFAGNLNLREERALRMIATQMYETPNVEAVVACKSSEFERHLEVVKNSVEELRSKVDLDQFGPIVAALPENVMIHVMTASVRVAAQDGLVRGGVNVVERIAKRLGLSKGIVGEFMQIMRMEEELCQDFFVLFMSRHGDLSMSPPASPR